MEQISANFILFDEYNGICVREDKKHDLNLISDGRETQMFRHDV